MWPTPSRPERPRLWLYGDPHGRFRPLLDAIERAPAPPRAVVLLGDMDLDHPLDAVLAGASARGVEIHWIAGNHDGDRVAWHDHLFASALAAGNLTGRVTAAAGLRVAGLGGVFSEKVWHPKAGDGEPVYETRDSCLASLAPRRLWRGGLPMKHRVFVWYEDVLELFDQGADVLVTHEAPSSHRYGFCEIDDLANALGARLIVHGHHHEAYAALLPDGTRVRGLAKTEIVDADALLTGDAAAFVNRK